MRTIFDSEELDQIRDVARRFAQDRVAPGYLAREKAGAFDRGPGGIVVVEQFAGRNARVWEGVRGAGGSHGHAGHSGRNGRG